MNRKIGLWVFIVLGGFIILATGILKFSQNDSWESYIPYTLFPFILWAQFALAMVFPTKATLIERVTLGLFFTAGAILLTRWIGDLASDWRDLLANWPAILIIIYLPVMLLIWIGYQKWEQRRK